MAGYQQVIAVGNVGRDAERKVLNNGSVVTGFSLATTRKWTDHDTKEKREVTTWFNVAAWGALAEVAAQYVKKGTQLMVVGTVSTRAWVSDDGEARSSLDLRADSFQLLGGRDSGSSYEADDQEAPSSNGGGGGSLEDIPFDHEAYP